MNDLSLPITEDTNLGRLLMHYPQTAEVLLDYGLHCVGCMASSFDTIKMGAQVHKMPDEQIQELVTRINEVIKHGE